MKEDNQIWNEFDDYLKGRLSTEEKDAFHQKLAINSELRKSFDDYKQSIGIIHKNAFKRDIASVMAVEKRRSNQRNKYLYIGIAASLLLLITAVLTITFMNDETSDVAALYQPYPNILQKRDITSDPLAIALNDYSKKAYQSALAKLNDISPSNDTIRFYSGLCHFSLGQLDQSISSLEKLSPQSIFYEQSIWYLGLAWYAKDDEELALQYLQTIKSGQFNFREASDLVNTLRQK